MRHYRLAPSAQADIAGILRASGDRHGEAARLRYRTLIAATLRRIAADPLGGATKRRDDLRPGTRSFHMRHAHGVVARVASPVHVVFYRVEASDIVEIVRVLHERMDPARHVGGDR